MVLAALLVLPLQAEAQTVVTLVSNEDTIGAGLEDLVFTLTRAGATTDELMATLSIVQGQTWLGTSDLSHTVTFAAGSDTVEVRLDAADFSFDPDASGDLTATVSGTGITGSSKVVRVVSTSEPPITIRYDMSEYNFEEDAPDDDVVIYAVATLHSDYPRAPSQEVNVSFSTRAGTAVAFENDPGNDYYTASYAPVFVEGDFELEGTAYVARKRLISGYRLEHEDGYIQNVEQFFDIVDDDIYEGPESFTLIIEQSPGLIYGLTQFAYPDGTTCPGGHLACDPIYTVNITDEEDRPELSVTAVPAEISEADDGSTPDVYENESVVEVGITNGKTFFTERTVTLSFAGTAEEGTYRVSPEDTDLVAVGHQVVLPGLTASVEVTLTAKDNAISDGSRTVEVSGSLEGEVFDAATLTITDDERPNVAPVFDDGTDTTREVVETAPAGTAVGEPVSAQDSDGDALTYGLEGADAAAFDIDTTDGQLLTKAGVDYDFEAVKNNYSVKVTAADHLGGMASIDVTVQVTDANEPPEAPDAPQVSGDRDSSTALKVSWDEPVSAGPEVDGYDLRYREEGTSGWTDGLQDVALRTATLENLAESTAYEVQVRASNDEGQSAWSQSGRGVTGEVIEERGDLRLEGGPTPDGGRLEVFYRNRWGTVCDDRFNSDFTIRGSDEIVPNFAPELACKLMGYDDGEMVTAASLGMDPGDPAVASLPIWLDDVRCQEGARRGETPGENGTNEPLTGLHDCYHAGIGLENCDHYEDVHLQCTGMVEETEDATQQEVLEARFENVPETHDGENTLTLEVVFSEAPYGTDNVPGLQAPGMKNRVLRDALEVTGGTATRVSLVNGDGAHRLVTVQPDGTGAVEIALPPGPACNEEGAICTAAGESLANTIIAQIPGPADTGTGPSPLEARFANAPPAHDGESAFTVEVVFSEAPYGTDTVPGLQAPGMKNRVLRDALEVTGGTATRVSLVNGDGAHRLVTVQPDGTGAVDIALPPGPACGEEAAICTEAGGRLSGTVVARVAGPPDDDVALQPPPLTARFESLPAEHDGASAFTVEVVFGEAPHGTDTVPGLQAPGMKNRVLRDGLEVTGGTVTWVKVVNGNAARRRATVQPDGMGPVDIALPIGPACGAAGAICSEAGGQLESALSTRVWGPASLSVADARVEEALNAVLAFAVTLDRAAAGTVTVDYATADGTAQAGADYTAASGTLSFAPGETAKTVSVAVLDDAHDEDEETLVLGLSNAQGARIEDGEATGTIENSDAMPKAWMARFGRTVAEQVLDAVQERMRAAPRPGVEVRLAGQQIGGQGLDASVFEAAAAKARLENVSAWLRGASCRDVSVTARGCAEGNGLEAQGMAPRELLMGSSFALTGGGAASGLATLWGRGAFTRFDGRDAELSLTGEVTGALLGADWTRARWTAGLMLSHARGEGSYRGADSGEVTSTLSGLYPYARYALTERVTVWGAAGYGGGTLTLTPGRGGPLRTDLDLMMAALGLRGTVVGAPAGVGPELAVTGDGLVVRSTSASVAGRLAAASAGVTRFRLGVEGTWRGLEVGTGSLTPWLAIGVRHDGGDAETGFGIDVGGGLAWSDSETGLWAELSGRGLLSHAAEGFRQRGVAGRLGWVRPGSERGPRATLSQTAGVPGSGGLEALLHGGPVSSADDGFGDELAGRRLELRLGYGFAALANRFTSTPEIGVGMTERHRDYSLGWRLTRDTRGNAGSLAFAVEGRRQESATGPSASGHSVGFRVTAQW